MFLRLKLTGWKKHRPRSESVCRNRSSGTLSEASEIARNLGVEATTLHREDDELCRAIILMAEGHCCNLIVMASHRRGGGSALLLGSETMKVLSHSNIPVLVVR